jgi:hypothetical protein
MRLVGDFLEEDPEEQAKRQRRWPAEKQVIADAASTATGASITSAEPDATGPDVSVAQMRSEVARLERDGLRNMPGRTAWMESRTYTTDLVQTARHRLRAWLIILGIVSLVFVGLLIVFQVAGARLRSPVRTVDYFTVIGLMTIVVLLACSLAIAVAFFQRRVIALFDPLTQDQAIFKALEYGDPRGDGTTGAYITRPALTHRLRSAVEERSGRNTLLRWLSSSWLLPGECRDSSVLILATERALDRWWDLGLLDTEPVVDHGEVRLIFSGVLVQGP